MNLNGLGAPLWNFGCPWVTDGVYKGAPRNDAMPGMYCVKRVNMDDTTIREYINNLSS
jgi:hypothetical protein